MWTFDRQLKIQKVQVAKKWSAAGSQDNPGPKQNAVSGHPVNRWKLAGHEEISPFCLSVVLRFCRVVHSDERFRLGAVGAAAPGRRRRQHPPVAAALRLHHIHGRICQGPASFLQTQPRTLSFRAPGGGNGHFRARGGQQEGEKLPSFRRAAHRAGRIRIHGQCRKGSRLSRRPRAARRVHPQDGGSGAPGLRFRRNPPQSDLPRDIACNGRLVHRIRVGHEDKPFKRARVVLDVEESLIGRIEQEFFEQESLFTITIFDASSR